MSGKRKALGSGLGTLSHVLKRLGHRAWRSSNQAYKSSDCAGGAGPVLLLPNPHCPLPVPSQSASYDTERTVTALVVRFFDGGYSSYQEMQMVCVGRTDNKEELYYVFKKTHVSARYVFALMLWISITTPPFVSRSFASAPFAPCGYPESDRKRLSRAVLD